MHLIIDADPIVYRSGFAAEEVHYHAVAEDKDGNVRESIFTPKDDKTAYKRMQEWLDGEKLATIEAFKTVKPEPVSHALMIVRQTLNSIIDETGAGPKAKFSILLSGPGNYREKLATYRPYKGNRDPEHKPYHYQAIRDYLTQQWSAIVVTGHEADDEASIIAAAMRKKKRKEPYVIASIDKDLHQIPGWHYDYRIKQMVQISEHEAKSVLWRQALSGDTIDNIPGACGIGAVKSQKLVEEWLDAGADDKQLWYNTVVQYHKSSGKTGCYYKPEDAEKAALENMRLVYLQQEPNELWVPPGHEPEYVEVGIDD